MLQLTRALCNIQQQKDLSFHEGIFDRVHEGVARLCLATIQTRLPDSTALIGFPFLSGITYLGQQINRDLLTTSFPPFQK